MGQHKAPSVNAYATGTLLGGQEKAQPNSVNWGPYTGDLTTPGQCGNLQLSWCLGKRIGVPSVDDGLEEPAPSQPSLVHLPAGELSSDLPQGPEKRGIFASWAQ